jgi:hypothetical protein
MAATNTRSKRSTSRNGSRATSTSGGRGSASKRTGRSSSANSRSKRTSGTGRRRSTSNSQSRSNVEAMKDTAVEQTKRAGTTIADAAGKAKTPLIAGGTALLGVAAGAAMNHRLSGKSKNPIKRLRGASPRKLDLETVKQAADRVSAYGQQASDIAAAVEKTRKKNG